MNDGELMLVLFISGILVCNVFYLAISRRLDKIEEQITQIKAELQVRN